MQRQVDADDDESGGRGGIRDQRERATILGDAVLVDHHRPARGRLDGGARGTPIEHGHVSCVVTAGNRIEAREVAFVLRVLQAGGGRRRIRPRARRC